MSTYLWHWHSQISFAVSLHMTHWSDLHDSYSLFISACMQVKVEIESLICVHTVSDLHADQVGFGLLRKLQACQALIKIQHYIFGIHISKFKFLRRYRHWPITRNLGHRSCTCGWHLPKLFAQKLIPKWSQFSGLSEVYFITNWFWPKPSNSMFLREKVDSMSLEVRKGRYRAVSALIWVDFQVSLTLTWGRSGFSGCIHETAKT